VRASGGLDIGASFGGGWDETMPRPFQGRSSVQQHGQVEVDKRSTAPVDVHQNKDCPAMVPRLWGNGMLVGVDIIAFKGKYPKNRAIPCGGGKCRRGIASFFERTHEGTGIPRSGQRVGLFRMKTLFAHFVKGLARMSGSNPLIALIHHAAVNRVSMSCHSGVLDWSPGPPGLGGRQNLRRGLGPISTGPKGFLRKLVFKVDRPRKSLIGKHNQKHWNDGGGALRDGVGLRSE